MHRSLIIQTQPSDYTPKDYKSFEVSKKEDLQDTTLISYPRKTKILQSFTYQKKIEEPPLTQKLKNKVLGLI